MNQFDFRQALAYCAAQTIPNSNVHLPPDTPSSIAGLGLSQKGSQFRDWQEGMSLESLTLFYEQTGVCRENVADLYRHQLIR